MLTGDVTAVFIFSYLIKPIACLINLSVCYKQKEQLPFTCSLQYCI